MFKCGKCEKEFPIEQLKTIKVGNRWWYQYKRLPIYEMTTYFCHKCYKKKTIGAIIGIIVFIAVIVMLNYLLSLYLK